MHTIRPLLLPLLLLTPILASAQRMNPVRHLTIFDANVAEFMEERTLDLQPGLNTVEFRSLMPQAFLRTLRVTGDRVTILTDMAIRADDIDEARAEEARRRAEARLAEALDNEESARVNAALANALAQIHVKRRHHDRR